MHGEHSLYSILRLAGVTCVLLSSVACESNSQRPVYPLQGQLFVDKKPAAGAVVWLYPDGEKPSPGRLVPMARVDAEGKFEVETYAEKDGAPAGKYRMAIMWRGQAKKGDEDGPNLISPRYMDPVKAGLPTVEVQPRPNALPPIHLTKN